MQKIQHGILKKDFSIIFEQRWKKFIQENIKSLKQTDENKTLLISDTKEYQFEKKCDCFGRLFKIAD